MEYNKEIVDAQISAMRFTNLDIAPDYPAISTITHNGQNSATWDRRFQILYDKLYKNPRYQPIFIPRGIWTSILVFDKNDSKLYHMMNEKTLSARRHEAQSKGFATHYVYSLLCLNEGLEHDYEQLGLIPTRDKDKQEYRIKDLKKMLNELVDRVKEVLITSCEYDHGKIIGGSIQQFDDNYCLIDSIDLSEQIIHPMKQSGVQANPANSPHSEEILTQLRKQRRSLEEKEKSSPANSPRSEGFLVQLRKQRRSLEEKEKEKEKNQIRKKKK